MSGVGLQCQGAAKSILFLKTGIIKRRMDHCAVF
jgi:hypothetical protein